MSHVATLNHNCLYTIEMTVCLETMFNFLNYYNHQRTFTPMPISVSLKSSITPAFRNYICETDWYRAPYTAATMRKWISCPDVVSPYCDLSSGSLSRSLFRFFRRLGNGWVRIRIGLSMISREKEKRKWLKKLKRGVYGRSPLTPSTIYLQNEASFSTWPWT